MVDKQQWKAPLSLAGFMEDFVREYGIVDAAIAKRREISTRPGATAGEYAAAEAVVAEASRVFFIRFHASKAKMFAEAAKDTISLLGPDDRT